MSKMFMQRLTFLFIFCFLLSFTAEANQTNPPSQDDSVASRNFWQLNRMLNYYENAKANPWPTLPSEPAILKMGQRDRVVLVLRERLRRSGDLDSRFDNNQPVFDRVLAEAVGSYQLRHGLKVDGSVGENTRNDMNVPPEDRIKQITVNMQRWANLSGRLGQRFIIVNIPDFQMHLFEANHEVLSLRAIVGKRDSLQTPELSSKITQIVLNPYWNIPPTIAKNDIAPKMLADSGYMDKMHIRAFRSEDNDASQVSSHRINWRDAANNGVYYHLRQDPGPENALGLVKFEFQNSHDVYMHDTSAKDLFNNYIRDFSHGCVRLENPFTLVEYLMKDNPQWNAEHIQEILEKGTTTYVKVANPIPIFITYITVWVDEEGKVNFRDDLYGLDEGIWNPSKEQDLEDDNHLTDQTLYN